MIETGDLGEIKRVKVELKGESDYLPDSEYFRGIAEKFLRYAGVSVVNKDYDAVLRVYITLEIYEDDQEEASGEISFIISDVTRFEVWFRSETFITAMTELILKIFGLKPLKKVLKRESPDLRAEVARALGKIGDARAVDALIEALKDEDSYVRKNVAWALGKIRDARAVDALIEALKDEDRGVRKNVAWALGEIGDARAVGALIEALRDKDSKVRRSVKLFEMLNDKDSDVRESVVEALGKIKDTRAVDALIEALKDENGGVRKSVAWALGEIGDKRAVDALIEALKDESSYVRESVIRALGKIGDARAVDALIEALKDMNSDVRKNVAKALGEIGDARAVDELVRMLNDEDSDVRESVAEALDKLCWEPKNEEERVLYLIAKRQWNECIKIGVFAVKYLIDALEVKDKRVVVVIKTKKVQDQELKSLLKSSEDDQDIGTKTEIDENTGEEEVISTTSFPENAKMALIKICRSDAKVIDILIEALKDERSEVRGKVAEALGEIRDARAVDALIEAFRDKNSDLSVRRSVVWALRKIGDVRAVDALIEALRDEDSDVRENSIDALVKIAKKDLGVVDKLIKALRDKDSDVRGGITKVLGNLGWDPKSEEERVLYYIAKGDWDECVKMGGVAVEFLIERLKDKNSDVHDKSIDALVKIAKKDLGVVDKLIKALRDEDSYVRISVAWALGEIGDARAVDALIEALRDEDRYVRESVAWALGAIGDARAVDSLIKTLKDDDYFVRESAKVALFRILGVYFEYDKQWMQWWEENRGKFLK
jgi:HEAT repeat protein